MPLTRRAAQAGPSLPPLPPRGRRRDRPPGRRLGRQLGRRPGRRPGGASGMSPRGISPPPPPSAPPPPPPPPPRRACRCCRCRCSRCRARTRSTASGRLAASWPTSACAAPCPLPDTPQPYTPFTCRNRSPAATSHSLPPAHPRSPPPPPAQVRRCGGRMQLHQRGRPPCLAAQDGAGVCTACTRTRVCSLTRRLHRASHIASPTLHRPCTDLAPTLRRPGRMLAACLPHAPRALAGHLPYISPISPLSLPSSRRRAAPPWARCSTSAPTRRAPSWRARPRSRHAPRAAALPPPAPLPPSLPRSSRRTACAPRPGEGRPPRRRRRRRAQKSRRRA